MRSLERAATDTLPKLAIVVPRGNRRTLPFSQVIYAAVVEREFQSVRAGLAEQTAASDTFWKKPSRHSHIAPHELVALQINYEEFVRMMTC